MSDRFDPYYTWLGIPPEVQPADFYRLLGVRQFEANEEVILNASDQRMAYLRTFQVGKRSKESQALLNEISEAQGCLLDPKKKQAYDAELRRWIAACQPAKQAAPVLPVAKPAAAPQAVGPIVARPTVKAQPVPLTPDPMLSLETAAKPLRPVVAPSAGLNAPLVLWIGGGAAVASLALLLIVVWAMSRPATRPLAANIVPPAPHNSSAVNGGNSPSASLPLHPAAPPEVAPQVATVSPARVNSAALPPSLPPPENSGPPPIASPEVAPTAPPVAASPAPATVPPTPEPTVPVAPAEAAPPLPRSALYAEVGWVGASKQLMFRPDGRLVASVGANNNSYALVPLSDLDRRITDSGDCFVFSSDGELFAHAYKIGTAAVYRFAANGATSQVTSFPVPKGVFSAAFSDDGRMLFLATSGPEKLLAYILSTKKLNPAITTTLPDVAWMGVEGDWLVCWSVTQRAEVISLRNPRQRQPLPKAIAMPPVRLFRQGATPKMLTLEPIGDGRFIFNSWDLVARRATEIHLSESPDYADVLAVSSDGKLAAVRRGDALALVRLSEDREVTRLVWPEGRFQAAALSTAEGHLAYGGPLDCLLIASIPQLAAQPRWRIPNVEELGSLGYSVTRRPGMSPPPNVVAPSPARPVNRPGPSGVWDAVKIEPGGVFSGGKQLISGWEFKSEVDLTVTHLGIFDQGGNGLATSHAVAIWNLDDQAAPVAIAGVPAGNAATLIGHFRLVTVERVKLMAGVSYAIVAHYPETGDSSASMINPDRLTIEFAPQLTVLGRRHSYPHDKMAFPNQSEAGDRNASIGPTFRFELAEASVKPSAPAPTSPAPTARPPSARTPSPSPAASPAAAIAALRAAGLDLPEDPEQASSIKLGSVRLNQAQAALLTSLPKLSSLDLQKSPGAAELLAQVGPLPELRVLHLAQTEVADDDLAALRKFPELRVLLLTDAKVTGPGLVHLKQCRKLEVLDLPPTVAGEHLVHLQGLSLRSFTFPDAAQDAALRYLANMDTLNSLSLPDITDEGMKTVASYANLESLAMWRCARVTAAGYAHLEKLRNLRFVGLPSNAPGSVTAVLGQLPNLQHLMLNDTVAIADGDLAPLTKAPAFKQLLLGKAFSDAALVHVGRMPKLQTLDLWSPRVSAKGIAELQNYWTLETLQIPDARPDDEMVEALARLSQLKSLRVRGLSSTQLQRLKQALPKCEVSEN